MARRRPRVNRKVFRGRAWPAGGPGVFFGRSWIVGVVPHAGRDRPIEGESHDQYQAGEAVGIAQMGLLETKPADLKSENMGSMPQCAAYPRVVRYPAWPTWR